MGKTFRYNENGGDYRNFKELKRKQKSMKKMQRKQKDVDFTQFQQA